jgi:murein DD-endopeptidase MepM/ murein hydrolase activator NlpD
MSQSIRVRDHLIITGVTIMSIITGYSIYEMAAVRNEAKVLRDQNAVVTTNLAKLQANFQRLRSYTESTQRIVTGGPRAASANEEHNPGRALIFASENNFSLAAKSMNAIKEAASLSDTEQFVQNMARIDNIGDDIELVSKRLSNISSAIKVNKDNLKAVPSRLPVWGRISSEYGERMSPFHGQRKMHDGIDIMATVGTPVYAPADGVVTFAGEFPHMGRIVVIDHGGSEMITRYGHLSSIQVRAGDKVRKDQAIAKTGNSGRSTGPHLHYEIWLNNQPVDPREFLFDMSDQAPLVIAPPTKLTASKRYFERNSVTKDME